MHQGRDWRGGGSGDGSMARIIPADRADVWWYPADQPRLHMVKSQDICTLEELDIYTTVEKLDIYTVEKLDIHTLDTSV